MSTPSRNSAWLWALAGAGVVWTARMLAQQKRKMDFRGKTVAITGGSRGLGLVMARLLAEEGARVAICARDGEELERAEEDLLSRTNAVFTFPCDITKKEDAEAFMAATREEFGPIDLLINNAGTIAVAPYEHMTEADFQESLNLHFWACYHTINAVLPEMRERRSGRIVNVASFGGKVPVPHLLPYVTGKFTLVGFSEGLRAEVAKDGVYVTTVCPGLIRTGSPLNAFFKGQNEKEYAWFKIGDSMPFLSVSAEHCAREIIEAGRYGKAEVIISLPAKLAAMFHGLFPGLSTDILTLVNGALPAPGGVGSVLVRGRNSESSLTQSKLTVLTDEAAGRNNE
ncbi:SDR family NAD(P)-dependent oxidoreductase [Tellurirhabdus rosea]|uniref:SDR family NAD(P)-dependent oxidoreductase n=1 Tax=Tellurirhabdus rosea TaxID=2674997 RepID=UPI00225A6FAC|nr:SDR family NAD(P)-dependent oxidoreductase [Tellurirhabdus rosea]